jgi:hypothetical protein
MKPSRRSLCRGLRLASLILVGWASLQGAVWAAGRPNAPEPPPETGANWLTGYAITLLAVALGLLVTLRSSNRLDPNRSGGPAGMSPEELRAAIDSKTDPSRSRPSPRGSQHCTEASRALIYSLVGLVICAPIVEPIALFLSIRALKKIRDDPRLEGRGMAIAALVISIIAIPLAILVILGRIAALHSR